MVRTGRDPRHDNSLSWACFSMGLWVLAACFDLFGQWRLLSPPWKSFFGDSSISLIIAAYAICGIIAGFVFSRFVGHMSLRWALVLSIPLYISFCALFLGREAHISFRGLVILIASVGISAVTGYGLRIKRPRPYAVVLILAVAIPLCLRNGYPDPSISVPVDAGRGTSNLILVTIDTLRPDHLGAAGYNRNISTGLDSLISTGIRFTNVSAPMPATGPSIASLLTGLYPRAHGVRRNGWPFPKRVESLARILRRAGYETGAVVSVAHLAGEYGWNSGFLWFDNQGAFDRLFPYSGTHLLRAVMKVLPIRYERKAEQSVQRGIGWLEKTRGPFFLWLHLWDPHYPYKAPDAGGHEFSTEPILPPESGYPKRTLREWINGYDEEIIYTDRSLDELWRYVRASGRDSNTVIAVVSDHGEALGERSYRGHSILLFEEQIRVLFILSAPMDPELTGETDVPASLVDVVPTLLHVLGIPSTDYSFDGINLVDSSMSSPDMDRAIFFESDMWGFRSRGLRKGAWKLIIHDRVNPDHPDFSDREAAADIRTGVHLYNISSDPKETSDTSRENPEIASTLKDLLDTGPVSVMDSDDQWYSPAMREQLEALGYTE